MRNHTKPRGGTNGGLGRGLEEPNLSGAYIRSLVKQLASSRKHAYPGGLNPTSKTPVGEASKRQTCAQAPMQIDREGSDNIMKLPSNLEEHASAAINPVVLQQKKQVRRRPHTRRQSQECLIDIAEARREIVAALHLHRAANGSATKPPPNPSIKPARINIRNSLSSKHSTSAKQSAGNNSTRCNSCMSKAVSSTATTQRACNEAKAITICGHLLCWMCLSQSLQHFSASPIFKRCPVCFKPLNMGNDIFPITLGVPILQASHESAYASAVLQSAPLLIDQLPAAQPAWSTTGPSLLPMSTGMNIAQNPSFYQHENMTDLASCSGPPERANLGLTNIEQDCPKNWHVAMDDEELSQIRSLGEQHDMEWNDTVNIATSTRWFKFLKSSEIPDCLYEREMEKNDNTGLHKLWEAPDDVGFDVQLLTEEPLISNFIDRNTIKECLHILPELPIESLWLDDCFDYHDCMQGLMNQENYNENNPLACSEILKSTSADDTAI